MEDLLEEHRAVRVERWHRAAQSRQWIRCARASCGQGRFRYQEFPRFSAERLQRHDRSKAGWQLAAALIRGGTAAAINLTNTTSRCSKVDLGLQSHQMQCSGVVQVATVDYTREFQGEPHLGSSDEPIQTTGN